MIIYKKDNSIRLDVELSEDSKINLSLDGEESATLVFVLPNLIKFEVGDYCTIHGNRYTLYKDNQQVKKVSKVRFEYTLKFETALADMANVNLTLFDNTTVPITAPYSPTQLYSMGNVAQYNGLTWIYNNVTATIGNTPKEGVYWSIYNSVSPYVSTTTYQNGDTAYYQSNIYRYIFQDPKSGKLPTDTTYWAVVRTAPQWDFSTTLTPQRYAQLIVDNMRRARPSQDWKVGYCIPYSPMQSSFSNAKCLDACSDIAALFNTEFWVDGFTLNFGKRVSSSTDTLRYGKGNGFKSIERNEESESKRVTRLIALGGEKNLKGTYRNGSRRLMLPDNYFIDSANIDLNNPLEDTQTWDDVFPCFMHATEDYDLTKTYNLGDQVIYNGLSWDNIGGTCTNVTPSNGTQWRVSEGTITTVSDTFSFIDTNLSFNPLDDGFRLEDGTKAKVQVITGNLAGYELPISSYDPLTKKITVETVQDGADFTIPTKNYGFKSGDQYFLVDIYLPTSKVNEAEQRLKAKALDYLSKYSVEQVNYNCAVDRIWARKNDKTYRLGDLIRVIDTDFNIDTTYRVIKIEQSVNNKYDYKIYLSTLPYIPSKLTKIVNSTEQNSVYIERNRLDKPMARANTYMSAKEALDLAFDPNGNYFTERIKPLIVEAAQLLIGTSSQQYDLNGVRISTYALNPNKFDWTSGTITDNGRTWNISAGSYTIPTNVGYYCYIVCPRDVSATNATLLFTTDKHTYGLDVSNYYYLYGTVGSLDKGIRQFYTSNGTTFISGDTIVAGRIKSVNGNVDIDLTNEVFKFGSNNSNIRWENGALKVKGNIIQSPSGDEFPATVYRGVYLATSTYYKGDSVVYGGQTWLYINDSPSIGNTPQDGAFWMVSAVKGADGVNGQQGACLIGGKDWMSTKIYSGTQTVVEAVKYTDGLYYVTRQDAGTIPAGTLPTNTVYWKSFGAQYESVATDTLLANGANIADFLFVKGENISMMESQKGIAKVNGVWVESEDRTNEDFLPHLSLNGVTGAIEINSQRASGTGGMSLTEKSEIKINQSNCNIEASNTKGVSYISPLGIFSNSARQHAFSAGGSISPYSYGAIVGLGFRDVVNTDVDDSPNLFSAGVIGVDGYMPDKGNAPFYGGHFHMMKAKGFCLDCIRIFSNTTLTRYNSFVSCHNTTDISVTMPPKPYAGQIVYVRQNNPQNITLQTSDGIHFLSAYGNSATFLLSTRQLLVSFIYDGQYWLANYGSAKKI